ncbi:MULTISPECIES: hypothetical protein [unclassified Coleofasciculus]|uniref:hypothetical protein n=1 Tax=unclassified Coleofasciculus TaxID=2692782 RepID=UPI00188087C0|nr:MULTISPECIES: hypothetical protein [unclassified Coleofasciculus]MBE9129344.1 hypothetical protein [Coleofasciculus sp. LEGE 07081]MBE9147624.1 hypothetical protein [Coleofasciculus sp. LEGE 07092]
MIQILQASDLSLYEVEEKFNLQQELPQYALSDEFTIANRENGLYQVLQILKRLKDLAQQD